MLVFIFRLKGLLHKLEVDFEEACYFQYGEKDCKPTFSNVPWSSVISFCIDYKLDCIDLIDPDSPNPQVIKLFYPPTFQYGVM